MPSRNERRRVVKRTAFPPSRRFVTAAMRVGRRMSPMHGLIEVDVTDATELLATMDPPASFTSFIVATVGRTVADHPEVHAYRDWLGRVVEPQFVDVTTIVEVSTEEGVFPLAHLTRDSDVRTPAEITAEIRSAKQDHGATTQGRRLERLAPAAGRIPGLARIFYQLLARSSRLRSLSGTVVVSSVGMLGAGGGHGIGFPTVLSLSVLVGGRSRRPVVAGNEIVARDVVDLTITFDHNVVDGAPAARFVADLRGRLENADLLR